MSIIKEFKEFAVRGNVVDMAIGIIIGAAFSKRITSFVGDVIMPPIGVFLGGVDFSNLSIVVKEAIDKKTGCVNKLREIPANNNRFHNNRDRNIFGG